MRILSSPAPPLATERADVTMLAEVRAGLLAVQKKLPSRHLYDARGIELLEEIGTLPGYYLARAEQQILAAHAPGLARLTGARSLVHLGPDSVASAGVLRAAMSAAGAGVTYVPMAHTGIALDTAGTLPVPDDLRAPVIFAWLGSAIGGFHSAAAVKLLRQVRRTASPDDRLVLGADLRKEHRRLVDAYNDPGGVWAELNRNVLRVVNARLGADFEPSAFEHRAFYNRTARRVEMHLVSTARQAVTIPGVGLVEFEEGETIRTAISCKFDRQAIHDLLTDAGFQLTEWWTDEAGDYAVAVGE
jgi:L-histidine Nalpha-methyltransferase